MTPERLALLTVLCPTFADFTAKGPIVHVRVVSGQTRVGVRWATVTYELKMFLGPPRHYEIWCEDTIIVQDTY